MVATKRVVKVEEWNPHQYLGLHDGVIRVWRPDADELFVQVQGQMAAMHKNPVNGLFEYAVGGDIGPLDYKIWHSSGLLGHDPYVFLPTLGEVDQYLFAKGVHYQLYNAMGGRLFTHQGVEGVKFAVWAPSARQVSLVGDFNHWDGRVNPMRCLGASGIWELFIPGLKAGCHYKFEIRTASGELKIKADPFALSSEVRPKTASKVAQIDDFAWDDHVWMDHRKKRALEEKPISIYELHLGSWRKKEGHFLNYREIAVQLAKYAREMGYTHVELMPVQEHPLDESWGYQVSGFYAVTSRFGTPEDFQWFVNHLHHNHIGVILDWVPGHFPTDDFSLSRFDGTALYEHEDPRQGFHPHWSTLIFNFGRLEVSNFLVANALFWFDKMHIDGLRVDAVASMLYLDYGRKEGEWIPNKFGGVENLEAIEFFKHLNSVVHRHYPGILMIAEESTAFPGVTRSTDQGGLGFDMKWNMGWMNDTLRYFKIDSIYRSWHHNDLTFGLLYAFSERFCLALSHDEVVHQKGSLLSKMPGDYWQKFANLRLLLSYQLCQPGKKLNFMGAEIGQWNEWHSGKELEWDLLSYPAHRGIQILVRDMNRFYHLNHALWERDFDSNGFAWIDYGDVANSVISYLRKSSTQQLLCIHNFTPQHHPEYFVHLPHVKVIREAFNSDRVRYGGSGKLNTHPKISSNGITLQIAPLATMIFDVSF